MTAAQSLQGKRIATTYPHILSRFLVENGITAEVVVLSGSVEIAPGLGRADLICDLVSTGSTLAANHLAIRANGARESGRPDSNADAIPLEKQEWTRRLLDAHRRRGAGQGQQVHHAARPPLRPGGNRETAPRQ